MVPFRLIFLIFIIEKDAAWGSIWVTSQNVISALARVSGPVKEVGYVLRSLSGQHAYGGILPKTLRSLDCPAQRLLSRTSLGQAVHAHDG